jgi:hypothetical protein
MSENKQYQMQLDTHMRLMRGGYLLEYRILDGQTLVGFKHVFRANRKAPEQIVYRRGEHEFATGRELLAAYQADKQ